MTEVIEPIVLIAAPEVLAIPVVENYDPLIDIKEETTIAIGPSPEIPDNTDYTKMRREVYRRLLIAQRLLPEGLQFCLYEAYRSLDLQKALFDERYFQLLQLYPDWPHEERFNETMKLISPVINLDGSKNVPPHGTGAAIDVYLLDQHGETIDMGIHPKDWMTDTDAHISTTHSQSISAEARRNRGIMSKALLAAGFANYPTEYWHWSYGDRYWAFMTGHSQACYGCVSSIPLQVGL
ncbi:D-alanyl-D-alanine dipeptidase [Legionella birminghamensis]|uniref:D-alanyl-D-alanine dipeptidase n=1 Tax=Legionella birminghamensis TaxID=28083 RepID=A0A378IL55_9GAMM|nr:M15 family metallopeptidase [Legionella birminghamensis]KTC72582.1 D-alanyl-D-alanine dipeptidase [Legionella birminghamensis]STX32854.1 D-alanyl-D-alanine dipeptidase [Legionella birminghamensis]